MSRKDKIAMLCCYVIVCLPLACMVAACALPDGQVAHILAFIDSVKG